MTVGELKELLRSARDDLPVWFLDRNFGGRYEEADKYSIYVCDYELMIVPPWQEPLED